MVPIALDNKIIKSGNGIIASVPVLAESGAFADSGVEAKRPVPECYLTADTESLRALFRWFWLYGGGIESHRK